MFWQNLCWTNEIQLCRLQFHTFLFLPFRFKSQFSILWRVANSIHISTHELKMSPLLNSELYPALILFCHVFMHIWMCMYLRRLIMLVRDWIAQYIQKADTVLWSGVITKHLHRKHQTALSDKSNNISKNTLLSYSSKSLMPKWKMTLQLQVL